MDGTHKRIAKNTVVLYIRMLITVLVGLYTTRVVLEVLGVSNYGIYSLVAGIMSLISFLKSSMSSTTSRFFAFEMGKNDHETLKLTFSTSLIIHLFFALLIFILGETVGMWFLEHKLVIPEGRMDAAKWVLQCSIFSSVISIPSIPYNSTIIAHENMSVFAYVEILSVSLKLFIVYLLEIGHFDKLELYATLQVCVSAIITLVYVVYCNRKYNETRFSFGINKSITKDLLGFSSWQMFVSFSYTLKQQGQNFLMNIYYGVKLNAAIGISDMLYGTLTSLSFNMLSAFQPPIYKTYASGDNYKLKQLISNAFVFSFLILAVTSVPFIVNINYLLSLWLKNVPQYVNVICIIALSFNVFGILNNVLSVLINASGKNRDKSLISCGSSILGLGVMWLILKANLPIVWAFVSFYIGTIPMIIGNLIISRRLFPELKVGEILFQKILTPIVITLVVLALTLGLKSVFGTESILCLISTTIFSLSLFALLIYFCILDKSQRKLVLSKIKHFKQKR